MPGTQSAYDEFASVFDSLTDKDDTNDQSTASDPSDHDDLSANNAQQPAQPADGAGDSGQPAAAGGDPAAADGAGSQDDPGAGAAGGDQGSEGVTDPAAADPAADPAAAAAAPAVDWQAEFKALREQFEAFKAGTQQPAAPAAAAAAAADPAPAAEETPVYTAEEKEELTRLQQEWPEVSRLIALAARQVQVDTLNYAFSEVGKVLAPLQETVGRYTTSDHMAAIYEAHEDYDQVFQPCMDWIEKQPSFLKAAYQNVVKQGTAEEVSTMIQRFKEETKWTAPAAAAAQGTGKPAAPAAVAPAPAAAQPAGLSNAAKQAARAMGAVGAKRGASAGAQDPNDFDGAWEEASSTK